MVRHLSSIVTPYENEKIYKFFPRGVNLPRSPHT